MGQKTKGGMWCDRCGPVLAVKNTHGVRNTTGMLGAFATGGLSLLAAKVENYACPNCGGPVHPARRAAPTPRPRIPVDAGDAEVTLFSAGDRKIAVIKVLRNFTGLSLKDTKRIADHAPSVAAAGIFPTAAAQLLAELEEAGATAEISSPPTDQVEDRSTGDLADDLQRLAALHAAGALTDEEFAAAKARILDQP